MKEAERRKNIPIKLSAIHHLCASSWQRGELDQCEELAQKGLAQTKPGEISISRARILLSLSATQAAKGNLQDAVKGMEEASHIFGRLVRKEKNATVLCNLAELQVWQGNWVKAQKNIQKSITLSQHAMYRRGEAFL